MTKVRVEHIKSDELHPLHCQYAGQTQPQVSYLELDVISGKLSAVTSGEIGDVIDDPYWHGPERRYSVNHGLQRRYPISAQLTADEINGLLDDVAPIAQQIINGARIEYDSQNNHIADLNDSAEKAEEEMEEECAHEIQYSHSSRGEGIWDAEVYFNMTTAEEIGLTSETTDEQLKQIIERERSAAKRDGRTVNGLEDYLAIELKTLRENALEETE